MTTPRADDWRSRGGYFSWRPAQGDASPVEIFHVEMGDPRAPVLLLIHGWPTSSIDWFEVADQPLMREDLAATDDSSHNPGDERFGRQDVNVPVTRCSGGGSDEASGRVLA